MSSLNKVHIIGRLGAEPEVRFTKSNIAVATLSVATTERYKDKNGEQQENVEWHKIVAWGRLAEICQQYLKKGSLAYFEGSLQTQEWEKEGVKRYTTQIKAFNMQMLDSKGSHGSEGHAPEPKAVEVSSDFDGMDDDLPF